ncbi:hypothetical protein [Actinomadura sp. 3N407]|uniref:hypothetical protein n=1 Tax=Actinomadura sp. 3N407 TaxID=3457423 RepID=UPI003FCD623C
MSGPAPPRGRSPPCRCRKPAGVLLGGALTASSWRLIFLINLPIGAVILVALLSMVPRTAVRVTGGADPVGALAVTLGLSLLALAKVRASSGRSSGSARWTPAPVPVHSSRARVQP